MQYLEPREASIQIKDNSMANGILSGSFDSVKFESNDNEFLKLFPDGNFDTLHINESNCTQAQQDVIEVARNLVISMLG